MKKKLLSLAVAAVAFTSMAFAQNATPSATTHDGTKTENVKGRKARTGAINPFEGISLSADQQTKLDALKAERKQKTDAASAERKQKSEAARAERQKKQEERLTARRAARRAELDKVKSILTPEQYVKYLENIALGGNRHQKAGKAPRQGKHGGKMARNDKRKGDKKSKQTNRGNGGNTTATATAAA